MSHDILSGALALLGGRWTLALLIELDLTDPVYLATAGVDIDWGGNVYVGGKSLAVSEVKDQGGEVTGMQLSLSGVPPDLIAVALAEPAQGKIAKLSLAFMDPSDEHIIDVMQLWVGTVDQLMITEKDGSATVGVTAEHRGMTYARPKGVLYSDGEQQREHPGDKSLEYLASQAQHQDVWPAASFFRQ